MRKAKVKVSYRAFGRNAKKYYTFDIPERICTDRDSSVIAQYVKAAYEHIHPRLTPKLGELIPEISDLDSAAHYLFSQPPTGNDGYHSYSMELESCRITYVRVVGNKKPRGSTVDF